MPSKQKRLVQKMQPAGWTETPVMRTRSLDSEGDSVRGRNASRRHTIPVGRRVGNLDQYHPNEYTLLSVASVLPRAVGPARVTVLMMVAPMMLTLAIGFGGRGFRTAARTDNMYVVQTAPERHVDHHGRKGQSVDETMHWGLTVAFAETINHSTSFRSKPPLCGCRVGSAHQLPRV